MLDNMVHRAGKSPTSSVTSSSPGRYFACASCWISSRCRVSAAAPISARSIIDAVSTGGSERKDERSRRLSPAALAVADRKVRSAYSPIVIAGVVRLIDFALISLTGVALYFGYGIPAVGDSWRYPILALGTAAAAVAVRIKRTACAALSWLGGLCRRLVWPPQ